jgi:hypothetical protein
LITLTGRHRVQDVVDDLDFEEMAAVAERPALIVATGDGTIAGPRRVGAVAKSPGLGPRS